MSDVRAGRKDNPIRSLNADLCKDLKSKQALLTSACKCLDDEETYVFFDLLASLSRLEKGSKQEWLEFLSTTGSYDSEEMGAIERLVMGEGAAAFKGLVDLVRDIRVQQEIDAMLP